MGHPNIGSYAAKLSGGGAGLRKKDCHVALQEVLDWIGYEQRGICWKMSILWSGPAWRGHGAPSVVMRPTGGFGIVNWPKLSPFSGSSSRQSVLDACGDTGQRPTRANWTSFFGKHWLECCGHLSSFDIAGERYASDPTDGESSMKRPPQQAV